MALRSAAPNDRRHVGALLLIALLVLVAAGKSVLYDVFDPDCFWHLKVAEQLHRDGVRPLIDELSFTSIKQPWTPYSWLAELGMKAIWDTGGFRAAVATQFVMVAMFYGFIAAACVTRASRDRSVSDGVPWLAVAVSLIASIYFSLPYFSFRPVTAAIVLLACCAWLLIRDRAMRQDSRAVWLIVPLTVLLINIHLFAIFVPTWIALLLIGDLVSRRRVIGASVDRWFIRRLALMLALTSFACLATPLLPGVIRSIAHYGTRDPMVAAGTIAEFVPFYKSGGKWFTGAILVACVFAIARLRQAFTLGEWLWLAFGMICLLRMGRLAPMFVIAMAPMLTLALPKLTGRLLEKPAIRAALAIILIVGIAQLFTAFPSRSTTLSQWLNRHSPDTPGFPTGAAEFVRENVPPKTGRLINDFNSGGYLAYVLGDRFKVFMDPRTQLYSPDFWERTALGDDASITIEMKAANADAAVVPHNATLMHAALQRMGWKEAFRDERAVVLLPPQN